MRFNSRLSLPTALSGVMKRALGIVLFFVASLAGIYANRAYGNPLSVWAGKGVALFAAEFPNLLASKSGAATSPTAAEAVYLYDVDTAITGTMTTATETGESQSKEVASRLKAQARLSPVSVDGASRSFSMQLEEPLEVLGADENGAMVPQPISAEVRAALKQAVLVQQQEDGTISGLQFPFSYPGLTPEEIVEVKNALRGIAGLFDYRILQPNSSIETLAEDVSGKYRAQFQRQEDGILVRFKLGYTEYAPGTGLFDISDGGDTPISSTMAHTGQAKIVLDAANRIQSLQLQESLKVENSDSSSGAGELAVSGTNLFTATLVLQGTEASSSNMVAVATQWGSLEPLRAQGACAPAVATADASQELSEAFETMERVKDPAGQGIYLARALRNAGETQMAIDWLLAGRGTPKMRKEVVFALGMMGTPDAQEAILRSYKDDQESSEVRARALVAIQAQVRPSEPLVRDLEAFAFQGEDSVHGMAKFALGSLAGRLGPNREGTADRIVARLASGLLQARRETDKQILVAALAASRREVALKSLAVALDDSSPAVRESVGEAIKEFRGPEAEHLRARVRAMAISRPELSSASIEVAADDEKNAACSGMAQFLELDPAGNYKCFYSKVDAGNLGFLGAYGRIVGGAGYSGDIFQGTLYAAARMNAGVLIRIFGSEIKFLEAWGHMGFHQSDSSKRRFDFGYSWLGWEWPRTDWYSAVGSERTGPVDLGSRGKGYKWCGPIGPFLFCIEVGVQLDYGVEKGWSGKTTQEELQKIPPKLDSVEATRQRALYWMVAPYGNLTAYVEGRVSFVCLKLAVRLNGKFFIHKYPIRVVLDFHDVLHSNDLSKTDLGLLVDEERQSWRLELIGTFKYCIGSKSKLLWEKDGPKRVRRLMTACGNKGDLVVQDFNWSVEKPSEAIPLALNVVAFNSGTYSTSPFTPLKGKLYADGVAVSDFEFTDSNDYSVRLFPGQGISKQVAWPAPTQGNHVLTVKLDEDHALADANPGNQEMSKSIYVHPRMRDFVIKSAKTTPLGSGEMNLEFEIANIGSLSVVAGMQPVSSDTCMVNFVPVTARVLSRGRIVGEAQVYRRKPTSGDGYNCHYAPSLENDTVSIKIPSTMDGVPIEEVDIVVDPDNQYQEVSEINNALLGFRLLGNLTQDALAPALRDLSAGGSMGQIQLSINGTDNVGISKVEFYVDGILKASVNAAPPYLVNQTFRAGFDSLHIPDGAHSLYAKGYDAAGNIAVTPSVSFNIQNAMDREVPVVTTATVGGSGGSISFSGASKDNVAIRRMDFYMDGRVVGSVPNAVGTLWKDSTVYEDGAHVLEIKAFDLAGNIGSSGSVQFTLKNDSQIPSAACSVSGTSGVIGLVASTEDNKGVARVDFYVDGILKGTQQLGKPYPTSTRVSQTFDSKSIANGSHTLLVRVYDASGNEGVSNPVDFAINNLGDVQAPVASGLAVTRILKKIWDPEMGYEYVVTYRISVNASDNLGVAKVDFYVGGELVGTRSTSSSYSVTLDSSYEGIGPLEVKAVAYDAAGNSGFSVITYIF